jgi:hypothetical protein
MEVGKVKLLAGRSRYQGSVHPGGVAYPGFFYLVGKTQLLKGRIRYYGSVDPKGGGGGCCVPPGNIKVLYF